MNQFHADKTTYFIEAIEVDGFDLHIARPIPVSPFLKQILN